MNGSFKLFISARSTSALLACPAVRSRELCVISGNKSRFQNRSVYGPGFSILAKSQFNHQFRCILNDDSFISLVIRKLAKFAHRGDRLSRTNSPPTRSFSKIVILKGTRDCET